MKAYLALTPTPAWSSNVFARDTRLAPRTGQTVVVEPNDTWGTVGATLAIAGTALGAYHGYRRNDSIGWAIGWAVLGGLFPIIAIPVAFAQGFGRRA